MIICGGIVLNTQEIYLMKYNTDIPYKKDKRDYARILATAASNKIISKTDKFRRSDYVDNNSIPRMCWTKYGN